MALTIGNVIITNDIINNFVSQVKNVILNGANHKSNIPYLQNYQCVPTNVLGDINSVPNPSVNDIGGTNNSINALKIYNSLVEVTHILTRVGTWSFNLYLSTDSGKRLVGSTNGTALFETSYIKTLNPEVDLSGVIKDNVISVDSINKLLDSCLTSWENTSRHHEYNEVTYCHSSCHSDCHNDCHNSCDECHDNSCHDSGGNSSCHTNCHCSCYGNAVEGCHNCHTDVSCFI